MKPTDRVVVYGSLGLRKGISDLLWAYRKSNSMEEFPAYLDDHPYQVMERIRSEKKNGMRTADVVIMPHYAVSSMGSAGELAGYVPAGAKSLRHSMGATKEGAVPIGVTFMAMAYNSKAIRERDLPSDLSDLSGPRWKGRLGTQSLTASRAGNLGVWYISFLRKKVGERRWKSFVQSLAGRNRPTAYDCIDHLLQGLLTKEVGLAMTVYSLAYFRERASGSPVALVEHGQIPHMMTFTSAALLEGSDGNESARSFMDFLLSPTAQRIVGTIPGIAPVLAEVATAYDFEHAYGDGTEFHPKPEDFEGLKDAASLFAELGLP